MEKKKRSMLIYARVLICIGALGQILLKHGMSSIGKFPAREMLSKIPAIVGNPYIMAGVLIYALGLIFWLWLLAFYDISFIYPLVAIGYIVTAIFAIVFLKETVTILRWSGIILIVIGSFLITLT